MSSSWARSNARETAFLGNALALLFPIDWPEPFGLVMIEAMACGTPVIAYRCGSVPEVVDHGVTRFIVRTRTRLVAARAAITLDREQGPRRFEERFSAPTDGARLCQTVRRCTAPEATRAHANTPIHFVTSAT